MPHDNLTRRSFVAFAGLALAGCASEQEEPVEPDSTESEAPAETPSRGRENTYPYDFITTLGPFDELVAEPSPTPGRVETLSYTTHAYAIEAMDGVENVMVEKQLNVWLPSDYDPARTYSTLYVLHGTGGMQDYWLGDPVTATGDYHGDTTLNLLDGMHDQGLFGDVIVVAPTYYSIPEGSNIDNTFMGSMMGGDPYADAWPLHFWRELRDDIIPLIESTYPVAADRDHRGFAGLSRGAMTVASSGMTHCTDLFAYFGSYSGAWTDFDAFKAALEGEFAEFPIRFWYNGNGSKDFSLENHEEFVAQALAQMPERFKDGENYAWVSFPGGEHAYNCWALDLYNTLLCFFK